MTRFHTLAILALAALLGCAGDTTEAGPGTPGGNADPTILTVSANPDTVAPDGAVALSVNAVDDDGDDLAYAWTCDAGSVDQGADSATAVWTAPSSEGDCLIRVVVSDDKSSARDSLVVSVREDAPPPPNRAPQISSVVADPDTVDPGGAATLTVVADDLDDDDLTYAWTAASGTFSSGAATAVAAWTAPDDAGSYTATVTVSDGEDDASADVTIVVRGVITPPAEPRLTNLFFLHNSTGRNLLAGGDARGVVEDWNAEHGTFFELWDHDYNHIGLMNPDGVLLGHNYGVPDDNTDPDGLHELWTTDNGARADILNNHEVIAFKSCYPASDIASDVELAQRKAWYIEMRDVFDQHPDKTFVVVSQPPRHRNHAQASPDRASRARAFATWLCSDLYLAGHPNVVAFDLFDALAHPDDGSDGANFLRYEYEIDHSNTDSHPNALANMEVGPVFTEALIAAGYVEVE